MNRKSLLIHLTAACQSPRIVAGSVAHRIRIRAVRLLQHRPIILFKRPSGIGDIICTFPSVLALRAQHPDWLFVYSVRQAFKEIVEMGRVADYVVEHDWSNITPKVYEHDYDACYRPRLEDEEPRGREYVHLVDDFADTLGVTLASRQPRLFVSPALAKVAAAQTAPLRTRSKRLIGIHVGPSWAVREWTPEGWEALVCLLQKRSDCTVIQLGSDSDTAKGVIRAPRISGALDWVGKESLARTVATIKELDLFIGIDSGLLHAAGAVGTPTIGLFGPINPAFRLPPETPSTAVTSCVPCLGCHHRLPRLHWQEGCPHTIRCMSELSAQRVFEACEKLLGSDAALHSQLAARS
jgi:ADP-heptose:LPS heptosyltransferase